MSAFYPAPDSCIQPGRANELGHEFVDAALPAESRGIVDYGLAIPGGRQRLQQCACQELTIAKRNDASERPVNDHLAIAPDIGGHNRQTTGHGFEEYVGPAFVAGGEDEDIGGRVGNLEGFGRDVTKKTNSFAETERVHLLLQLGRHVPFRTASPDCKKVEIRINPAYGGQALDDSMKALALRQCAHRDQDLRVLG